MKFRCKYTYEKPWGNPQHVYTVLGRHGAMHFHVTDMGEAKEDLWIRYSGGLEVHYRTPPDYMADAAPSQDKCWLLKCPCWHDGTSLYASERVIPFWLAAPNDHERMFQFLIREYEDRFSIRCEADAA
jgi:hypothetical protein